MSKDSKIMIVSAKFIERETRSVQISNVGICVYACRRWSKCVWAGTHVIVVYSPDIGRKKEHHECHGSLAVTVLSCLERKRLYGVDHPSENVQIEQQVFTIPKYRWGL